MRKLLPLVAVAIIAVGVIAWVVGNRVNRSGEEPSGFDKLEEAVANTEKRLWEDTIAAIAGHSLTYKGDITDWDGVYYDGVRVGDDIMLKYDSVGPTVWRLDLATRELLVDFKDPKAGEKIRAFMDPLGGLKRFRKSYSEVLDSVEEEGSKWYFTGSFSFMADYADTCLKEAAQINRFLCDLTGISKSETAKVPGLSAFYAGYQSTKYYRPVYSGDENNMQALSDFLAHKTFENWKIEGAEAASSSNGGRLEFRAHVLNPKFLTVSKYEYDRIGIGHGMYTETFHTLDLERGKALTNADIFKSGSMEKVKRLLFEEIAGNPRYKVWNRNVKTAEDVEAQIRAWQQPSELLKGTAWEEPEREYVFEMPEGALTESGVLFSFQPYEIDCWAAGSFHFIVPYKKLMRYLRPEVKRMVN